MVEQIREEIYLIILHTTFGDQNTSSQGDLSLYYGR